MGSRATRPTSGSTPIRPKCSASCRAQIERTIAWGIDPTHLAPHLTAITLRPEFFDVYLELACEFRLPIRLPSTVTAEEAGFPFRKLAADEGVVFPDHFDHDWRAGSRVRAYAAVANLEPGVTEIHVQPVIDTPEVHALSTTAHEWIDDLALGDRRRAPASPARRAGRDVDRVPSAQGRDASWLSRLVASPDFSSSSNRPGVTRRLHAAAHELDRRVETLRAHHVERCGHDDVGVVGSFDPLVLLADDDPVLHAHVKTFT